MVFHEAKRPQQLETPGSALRKISDRHRVGACPCSTFFHVSGTAIGNWVRRAAKPPQPRLFAPVAIDPMGNERNRVGPIREHNAFMHGNLLNPAQGLYTIMSVQFVVLLAIIALISTFAWRQTGSTLPGALISGLFLAWYIVASQAMQAA